MNLAAGIAWILFAFILLSFNYRTVWAIAVLFGIGFIVGGFMEFAVAGAAPSWKWLYVLIGIVSIVAGVIALVWPGQTFLVLSAIAGWLLLFYGIIDIVFAFSTRHLEGLWWTQLFSGIIMVLLGFSAVRARTMQPWRPTAAPCCWSSGSASPHCSAASPTSSSASGCAPPTITSRRPPLADGQHITQCGCCERSRGTRLDWGADNAGSTVTRSLSPTLVTGRRPPGQGGP